MSTDQLSVHSNPTASSPQYVQHTFTQMHPYSPPQVLSPRPLLALASLYALVRTLHSAQMAHPSVLPMIVRGPLGFLPGVIILAGMGALLVLHCVPMVAAML